MAKPKSSPVAEANHGPLEPSDLPAGVQRGLVERPNQNWGVTMTTPLNECPTNLDLTTPRGRKLLVTAAGIQDYRLEGKAKIVVKATNYIAYATEMENETTGELQPRKVSVLIDKDGLFYKTTGFAAFDVLRAASVMFNSEEWAEGVSFVISWKEMPSGHRAHDVRVLFDAEDVTGPPSQPH